MVFIVILVLFVFFCWFQDPTNTLRFVIAIVFITCKDDATLVVSAAGSDMVCVLDATTGSILGRVKVDSVPRGIALVESERGAPTGAWVLNAVANTVSVLDLSDLADPR